MSWHKFSLFSTTKSTTWSSLTWVKATAGTTRSTCTDTPSTSSRLATHPTTPKQVLHGCLIYRWDTSRTFSDQILAYFSLLGQHVLKSDPKKSGHPYLHQLKLWNVVIVVLLCLIFYQVIVFEIIKVFYQNITTNNNSYIIQIHLYMGTQTICILLDSNIFGNGTSKYIKDLNYSYKPYNRRMAQSPEFRNPHQQGRRVQKA